MTHVARPIRLLACLLACLLLAGCGSWAQGGPVAIDIPVPTRSSPAEPDAVGPRTVTVYFIRDDRLEPAERAAPDRSIEVALELLASGPTARETRSGLRTALRPPALRAAANGAGTVVVEVTRELIATSGTDQLLAVAQVVWTVTEVPGAPQHVRMTSDGNPIEVPTDRGLSTGPVTRDDFRTVAPRPEPSGAVVRRPALSAVPPSGRGGRHRPRPRARHLTIP